MRRPSVWKQRMALWIVLALGCGLSGLRVSGEGITAAGTGFVVSASGYILTNEHVIHDAESITVYAKGSQFPARVVVSAKESDLALLKIEASGLTTVPLGDSLRIDLLSDVVAMGYLEPSYGRDLSVSQGHVTSFRTNVEGRGGRETIQHDATIYHGSSGGPLLDLRGEVIGVNYAGIEGTGIEFAIPINEAVPLLRSVPGFRADTMGTATAALTPSDILTRFREAVVFIEVTVHFSWQEFLPQPATISGFPDESAEPVDSVSSWLTDRGFQVTGGASIKGSDEEESEGFLNSIALVAFSDASSAQRAAQILLTDLPILSSFRDFCVNILDTHYQQLHVGP